MRDDLGLYIVADGVGSKGFGAAAAKIIVEQMPAELEGAGISKCNIRRSEKKRILNDAVMAMHYRTITAKTSGKLQSTLVAALIGRDGGIVAHLGDSRAYVYRNGDLIQLTKDHSYRQQLIDSGELDPLNSPASHHRSQLVRCVGMYGAPAPDIREFEWLAGDILLLCSDGLTSMLSDDQIRQALASAESVDLMSAALVDKANQAGGTDNITVVVVRNSEASCDPTSAVNSDVRHGMPETARWRDYALSAFGMLRRAFKVAVD